MKNIKTKSLNVIAAAFLVILTLQLLYACETTPQVPAKRQPADTLLVVPLRWIPVSWNLPSRQDPLTYNFLIDGEWFGAPFTFSQTYAFIRGVEPGKHTISGMEGKGQRDSPLGMVQSFAEATLDISFVLAEGRMTILRSRLTVQELHENSRGYYEVITLPELSDEELAQIRRDLWGYRNIQQWMAAPP